MVEHFFLYRLKCLDIIYSFSIVLFELGSKLKKEIMAYKSSNPHVQGVLDVQSKAFDRAELECIREYGKNLQSNEPIFNETIKSIMCPPFYDTILCWPPQLPGTTASVPCPSGVLGFMESKNATRQCIETGRWFTKHNGGTYTNYSSCITAKFTTVYTNLSLTKDNEFKRAEETVILVKALSETGYAVSLISLIIAFTIMFKIKKLHCARNILHMNLFASFILRYFMHILKEVLFQEGLALPKDILNHNGSTYFHIDSTSNNFECKLIVSLVQYFTTANFSWILMEGVYLNNLILRALFTDSNRSLVYYISFGWGLPLLVVIPWVVARIILEDTLCWTTTDRLDVFLIILIPTITSVLINLVLFVIISVVLYTKLKSPINEDSRRYLKWAKSTLVLVPLFGVNYAITLILYFLNNNLWITVDSLFGSFQGFFVAILYCFMNGEVKSELKPHIQSILIFLATNNATKCCFPRREKYLSSAAGRQSVCTTMSCSSLYNNGVSQRNCKTTKCDQLSKVKLTNLHADQQKDNCISNGVRHSVPKTGHNGHFAPNLTFVHGRYPMNMTTSLDTCLCNDIRPHHYSQNLPTCEEEASMLGGENNIKNNLELV